MTLSLHQWEWCPLENNGTYRCRRCGFISSPLLCVLPCPGNNLARRLAVAVLLGDMQAALALADLVLEQYHAVKSVPGNRTRK